MAKLFTDYLSQLKHGALSEEAGEALAELIIQCRATGKKGKLLLSLEIRPGKHGTVEIFDDVIVKAPESPRDSTMLFDTPEGNWQFEDPAQRSLPGVRVVTDRDARQAVPTIIAETGEVLGVPPSAIAAAAILQTEGIAAKSVPDQTPAVAITG